MRISVHLNKKTRDLIESVRTELYEGQKVTVGGIISQALTTTGTDPKFAEKLRDVKKESSFYSQKITISAEAHSTLRDLMQDFQASDIINTALEMLLLNKDKASQDSHNRDAYKAYQNKADFHDSPEKYLHIKLLPESCRMLPLIYGISLEVHGYRLTLYVGKTTNSDIRSAEHMQKLFQDSSYLGLSTSVFHNHEYILRIDCLKLVDPRNKKENEFSAELAAAEENAIRDHRPLLMRGMRMISSGKEKIDIVEKAIEMIEKG